MKKNIPLYVYGAIIIGEGLFLILSNSSSLHSIKIPLGFGFILGSVFAFFTAMTRRGQQVQYAYHQIHALSMLAYGLAIIFYADTIEMLIYFTAFLLLFYSISEIAFCNWIFNLGKRVVYNILIVRLVLGFAAGIASVVSLAHHELDIKRSMSIFGAFLILIGINVVFYAPVIKRAELQSNIA
jgi:uncharacterized membrane protein HdeD (DUF308 family)